MLVCVSERRELSQQIATRVVWDVLKANVLFSTKLVLTHNPKAD